MRETQENIYSFGEISGSIEVLMMCTIGEVIYSAIGFRYRTGILS